MSDLSARNKKLADPTPFDRHKVPPKQNLFLMPLIWLYCFFATRSGHLKIHRKNMKGLKPPYIVFCSHHAWMDFYVTPLALFPHRANYVSEMEGFEFFGEWAYRQIGCLGTRKFVNDIALVRNIKRCIERKGILVIYPEARYANVGTSSELPPSVGKLVKNLGVPMVCINMRGNYIQSPIWNTKIRKQARLDTEIIQLLTSEQIKKMTHEQVTQAISGYLAYDDYIYQLENKIKIDVPWRAEGLHKVLYRCPECNSDFSIRSEGAHLYCENCGNRVTMNIYGRLVQGDDAYRFSHIPDWYEWQRQCVIDEIERGEYKLDVQVHIEALPGSRCFLDCGTGHLTHSEDGFSLSFTDFGNTEEKTLHFSPASMFSVHTEYNYRERGECITLSTLDCTYFLFPQSPGFNPTKIQFAAEYLHKRSVGR